nr:hypothetical protein [Neobacillus sp. Marseille-Q6967]
MKKIKIILFGVLIIFYLVSFFIGSNKSSAASYLYFTLFLNYLFNLPCLGLCLFILILVIKKIRAGKRELINEELTKKARNRIESGRKTDKKGLLACLIAITIMVPVFLMDYDHILD